MLLIDYPARFERDRYKNHAEYLASMGRHIDFYAESGNFEMTKNVILQTIHRLTQILQRVQRIEDVKQSELELFK